MKRIVEIVKRESFHPSLLGLIINDFYIPRRALLKFIQSNAGYIKGSVLDIGCGSKPYKELFSCNEYIGVDIENEGHSHIDEDIEYYYDGKILPFENNSFDNAVCFEVLEHVFEPDLFLTEVSRVLKPGGHLLLTTPFIWNEHEVPSDYGRYSSYGLKYLMNKNGFEVVSLKKILNGPEFFIVLLQVYINDFRMLIAEKIKFIPKIRGILLVLFSPLIFVLNLIGLLLSLLIRDNRFYFNNGIIVKKK